MRALGSRMNSFTLVVLAAAIWVLPYSIRAADPDPTLIQIEFPTRVGEFQKTEIHHYDERALGYKIKYLAPNSDDVLDVYVFPVDDQNKDLSHESLVAGYFSEARQGIDAAVSGGLYISAQDYGVVEYRAGGGKIRILRSKHTIVTARGEFLSHAYVTEHHGVVVKIRVSVSSNAHAAVFEKFQDAAFSIIEIALDAIPVS